MVDADVFRFTEAADEILCLPHALRMDVCDTAGFHIGDAFCKRRKACYVLRSALEFLRHVFRLEQFG